MIVMAANIFIGAGIVLIALGLLGLVLRVARRRRKAGVGPAEEETVP